MLSARWRKLLRDVRLAKGRTLLMVVAVAVSLSGVGTLLGSYAVLDREMAANYLGTRPATAALEVAGGVDAALVEAARRFPGITEAEARDVVLARAEVGGAWRPLLLFVIDDFERMRLNTFRPVGGAWPPAEGTMLIERTAQGMLGAGVGGRVMVKAPNGKSQEIAISGLVHDPGLAPAWQERSGYGYVTRATLARLGEPPVLHELRVEAEGEEAAIALAGSLPGAKAGEIRIPPRRQHPHQRQMRAVMLLLGTFGALALALSAILVATSVEALLARQTREIGVMKAVGASTAQIAGMYSAYLAAIGAAAALLAVPSALAGAGLYTGAVAGLLNLELTSTAIPAWVFAAVGAAGVLVPLAAGAGPVARASRATVREAMDRHGATPEAPRRVPWSLPVRNALRRRGRLALTVLLFAAGGAMFIGALDTAEAWDRTIAKVYQTRFYDVECRLQRPQPPEVAERLRALPGVRRVERWGFAPTAFAVPGRVDVVRTYPDKGHGSLNLLAPPPGTALVRFPVLAGRWLEPGDEDVVVLNHTAAAGRSARVGERIALSVGGHPASLTVVGVVEEIGSPGAAYLTDTAYARLAGAGDGARLLRIAADSHSPAEREAVLAGIERELDRMGVSVEAAWPLAELRTAMGDHIRALIATLIAMALLMAAVGMLGLGSTMSTSVLERTRELGVLKAIGATPARVAWLILAEALIVGALSWVVAVALALPLTAAVGAVVGRAAFVAPLPLVLAWPGVLGWGVLTAVGSVVATLIPALRAARMTVREAIAHP